jgi:hypothetical protein
MSGGSRLVSGDCTSSAVNAPAVRSGWEIDQLVATAAAGCVGHEAGRRPAVAGVSGVPAKQIAVVQRVQVGVEDGASAADQSRVVD